MIFMRFSGRIAYTIYMPSMSREEISASFFLRPSMAAGTVPFLPDDPKSGYPGHLSASQEKALSEFKAHMAPLNTVPKDMLDDETSYNRECLYVELFRQSISILVDF